MERLSKIGIIVLMFFAIGITGLVVDSCRSDNEEVATKNERDNYIDELHACLNTFMKADIVSGTNSRGRVPELPDTGNNGFQTVLIDFSGDLKLDGLDLDNVKTPEDMMFLCQEFGAEFSFEDDGMRDDSIQISVEAAEQALAPLAQASRNFLKHRGLTDEDMDAILVELNTDNSCFIFLAMALCVSEEEKEVEMNDLVWSLNPFALTAHAASGGEMAWNCAVKAIGIRDIKEIFSGVAADVLTKAVATKVLKIAVPKLFGWVGAAVMLVEFADCLAHYNRYFS